MYSHKSEEVHMSIRIIATDLDGTLMAPDHLTVTQYTRDILKKVSDKGVKLAVATGRPLSLTDSVIEQIPFTDYVIYSNGACVFDRNKGKNIYTDLISPETAYSAVRYFLNEEVFFEIYIDGKSHYQLGRDKYYDSSSLPSEFIDAITCTMTPHENLLGLVRGKAIEKITLYSIKKESFGKYSDRLKSYGLAVTTSLDDSLDATSKTADKGNALRGICEAEGFTPDEAMSFGDAGNDCPMLDFAKYSFAMENGSDECKSHAKYTARSNADDGVARAVEEYCLR